MEGVPCIKVDIEFVGFEHLHLFKKIKKEKNEHGHNGYVDEMMSWLILIENLR